MIEPREYQLEALEAVISCHGRGVTRQLISLPTGTGKTVLFALLAKEINARTLVIAHTQELIDQAVAKFKIVWPEVDIGIVKAESDEVSAKVVVASIQTACRDARLQKLKEQGFDLMIIDEAHHATADSYGNVIRELGFFENNPQKLLVGLTATPKRGDGAGLGSVFQEIVFDRSLNTMIRAGYLSQLLGKQVLTRIEIEGIGVRNGDFIASELSKQVNTEGRNQLIIDNYKAFGHDRKKGLAFCVDVRHSKDLAGAFNDNGITACAVYGDMPKEERVSALQGFREGKYQVLTNCQLLTEGFDAPEVDCVILGRPTKSSSLFTQMIGRGTRTFPQKQNCLILDFTDNVAKHDLCTCGNTLDGAVTVLRDFRGDEVTEECEELSEGETDDYSPRKWPRVYQDRIEDINLFDSVQFSWVSVGDSWHLSLGSNRDVWVRQVNGGFLVVAQNGGDILNLSNRPLPLNYALGVGEDWGRRQTPKSAWIRKDAPWRSESATSKQLETLTKLGVSFDYGISKGQAAQLLDRKFNEPATSKQLYWLKTHGIKFDPGISKMNAMKIISQLRG